MAPVLFAPMKHRRFATVSLALVVLVKSEGREETGVGVVMRAHFSLICHVLVSLTGWL